VRRTRRHQRHRERVMRAHQGICHICGEGSADAIDHIVPVSWGGSDDPSNLAPAHTSCNTKKGNAPPPHWTYDRPAMWLPGYGPRAQSAPTERSGAGCLATGSAVFTGVIVAVVVSLFGLTPIVGIPAGVLVAWLILRSYRSKVPAPQPRRDPGSTSRPQVQLPDGSAVLDARGTSALGGTAADVAPEGDAMVKLAFEPTGPNVETLIALLDLSGGRVGYRDGLTVPTDGDLVVNAMVRLAADVAADGDDDVTAAPVGRVPADQWSAYPVLGLGVTFVQVALTVDRDGTRRAWIMFRASLADL
jgi:hypothetical protein